MTAQVDRAPTTDQLYHYARRWFLGFRARAVEQGKAGDWPTVRQCAKRFGCRCQELADIADEGDLTGDGYMGTAFQNVDFRYPVGDRYVEAYGRTGEDEVTT